MNKGQINLAKGDIALLSYSPGGSTRHEFGPGGCMWDLHFGGKRRSQESSIVPFERAMVVFLCTPL